VLRFFSFVSWSEESTVDKWVRDPKIVEVWCISWRRMCIATIELGVLDVLI
jgi:hypothetical protein